MRSKNSRVAAAVIRESATRPKCAWWESGRVCLSVENIKKGDQSSWHNSNSTPFVSLGWTKAMRIPLAPILGF